MKTSEINPWGLPRVALSDKNTLPSISAVYFVLDEDRILYVGKSVNLSSRWANHHRYHQIKQVSFSPVISWLECPSVVAEKLERECIATFYPELNGLQQKHLGTQLNVFVRRDTFDALEILASKASMSKESLVRRLAEEAVKAAKEQGVLGVVPKGVGKH